MQKNTRVRALCCACGNLRTANAQWARRFEPADTARSSDDGDDPRGWRMTRTLKCTACKAQTVHALLSDDQPDCRDLAEEREHQQQRVCKLAHTLGFTVPAGELAGLNDAEWRWTERELRVEAIRQAENIMGKLRLEDLTLAELGDLLTLLKSFMHSRGGPG